ncbi:ribonuclease E inhibitor RraB [Pseudarthrobacter sp. J1738]|uniref:ribonuclease E inhibitor RraB n=1 Tax=unclassified Pseudarthrobacter TaxID=2647000 RepID=UPI003D28CEC0
MTTLSQELAQQRKLTVQQLQQRRSMSDRLSTPRKVDHSGEFPEKQSATDASLELASLGYETRISEGRGYVLLEAHKVTPVDPETVEKFTEEVLTVFHKFGGDYEGWGGPVVTS